MFKIYTTKNPQDYERKVNEGLLGKEGFLIHICESPCGWTGMEPTVNWDECAKRNIFIGTGHRPGGTIVNMDGDITVCITKCGPADIAPKVMDEFATYLKRRKLSVTRDRNDILVDEKKVVSWAGATLPGGITQEHIHFSVGKMDLELVQAICTKAMYKIPGSLEEFGITSNEIYEWVCNTLEGFNWL